MYCKGTIAEVMQASGCIEVTVKGESPGVFIIDNCCVWEIVDAQGRDWIGRSVEYEDGQMRFLDSPEAVEVARPDDHSPDTIPFPHPARSTRHI